MLSTVCTVNVFDLILCLLILIVKSCTGYKSLISGSVDMCMIDCDVFCTYLPVPHHKGVSSILIRDMNDW